MQMDEYQKLAARTINPDLSELQQLNHGVLGLNAQAGEVASLLQKEYQGHEWTFENLVKELGDVLWMVAQICTSCELSLSDVAEANIAKLKARYPSGFDRERSIHRSENDK